MTVRSKQSHSADIVSLPSARVASSKNLMSSGSQSRLNSVSDGAELLSIRQHLAYKASVGIRDYSFLQQSYSVQVAAKLFASVRELLDQEFGCLRVHRWHQVLVVSHNCHESMIAGLLRVQFHCHEIPLPATRESRGNGLSDICGVPLIWGIGTTLLQAEEQRISKQESR